MVAILSLLRESAPYDPYSRGRIDHVLSRESCEIIFSITTLSSRAESPSLHNLWNLFTNLRAPLLLGFRPTFTNISVGSTLSVTLAWSLLFLFGLKGTVSRGEYWVKWDTRTDVSVLWVHCSVSRDNMALENVKWYAFPCQMQCISSLFVKKKKYISVVNSRVLQYYGLIQGIIFLRAPIHGV